MVRTARRGVSRKIRTLTSRCAPLSERLEQARSSAVIHWWGFYPMRRITPPRSKSTYNSSYHARKPNPMIGLKFHSSSGCFFLIFTVFLRQELAYFVFIQLIKSSAVFLDSTIITKQLSLSHLSISIHCIDIAGFQCNFQDIMHGVISYRKLAYLRAVTKDQNWLAGPVISWKWNGLFSIVFAKDS